MPPLIALWEINEIMFDGITRAFERVMLQDDRWRFWLSGLQLTLIVTFFALLLGLALGLIIALIRVGYTNRTKQSPILAILNGIAKTYVTVIRGIPMVVQLMVMNFVILAATRNPILIASLAFGFNSAAYVSEIFRGSILSIDKGQTEAGRSLGLSQRTTMIKIVLPQALKNAIPTLGNEFISLLKETAVAGYVAITDLTHVGNVIRGLTFDPTPLFVTAGAYLILVMGLEFLIGRVERRLRKSDLR